MPGGLTAAAVLRDPLQAAVDGVLDARLERGVTRPLAIGISGGGDSIALLHLAADWSARAGRPLRALTVDHGLHPHSAAWTARAGAMAVQAGARWRSLVWEGVKPSTGLAAAARTSRHALLAEAAREAGACVLLLAHTADDVAEGELMRRVDAPTLGRLRAWAPSPVWPEGRGVFLLRPLLGVGRGDLRAWMTARGLGWLDDPANTDPRHARVRARSTSPPRVASAEEPPGGFGEATPDGRVRLPRTQLAGHPAARRTLRAALACASGASARPGGATLDRLLARLAVPGPVSATAGGALLRADETMVEVGRELGRRSPSAVELLPGRWTVWDGRFLARAEEGGWRVAAAAGRLSQLSHAERTALQTLPAWARPSQPVFVRDDLVRLAGGDLAARPLVGGRFDAAVGRVASEEDVQASVNHNQS